MSTPTFKERLRDVNLIFACGTTLFSAGYSNGVIGSVNTLLHRIYDAEQFPNNYSITVNGIAFAGNIVGMLVFGWISDKIGRKFGMMSAAGIVAFFAALSSASSGANHSVRGLLAMLIICRFFLGIGIGAGYPCGSVSCAEQTEGPAIARNAQHRWLALATNNMIDSALCVSALVPLVLFWICGPNHLFLVWRLSLGLGFFPALTTLIWRWNTEEPDMYKKNSMKTIKIPYWLVFKRYGVQLAAVSFTWFLYDFIKYPFGIYSSTIINTVTGNSESLTVVFGWNTVINLFYMPGAIVGAFCLDHMGPKWSMISGLLVQAAIGLVMSGFYNQLKRHIPAFAVLYGVFLCFGEFGPGNNTILLASKSSPTAVRGQFYGVAAAVGKVGALVGLLTFQPMMDAFGKHDPTLGNTGPFWLASGLAVLSALVTYFFISPLDHDSMAKEDAAFREYLEAKGFDTSGMGFLETETRVSSEIAHENKNVAA
ncbi:MFS Git1p-related glycerophosphoinositol and glycerophosphocholine permease [Mycena olivaceomarginata]|nr:MFS Git1p-related glycerophosphoinositol and glycerophosphocholine permease [Mycena olivaceomarginata]KAJ7858284.1 MFS Git1p-related glycerophosphoinositol and glycerophosphocholine permease [Mycena olivaceomarginata]